MADIDDEIMAALKKLKSESEMVYSDFASRIPENLDDLDDKAKEDIKQALDDIEAGVGKAVREIRKILD